jgi:hypothetical protein
VNFVRIELIFYGIDVFFGILKGSTVKNTQNRLKKPKISSKHHKNTSK